MDLAGILLIFTTILLFVLFSWGGWRSAANQVELSQTLKWIGFYGLWLVIVWATGYWGLITDFSTMPPKMAFFVIAMTISAIMLAYSSAATRILMKTPIAWVVGFQAMRILAETALWDANRHGLAPVQMTFHGYNFDIITGIASLLLIPVLLHNQSKGLVTIWSLLGSVLLLTIISIALLSTPTPFRVFMNEPANTWVTRLPYIFLPGALVHAALAGHIMVFRWLFEQRFNHASNTDQPAASSLIATSGN
jgi:hypothetical protein